MKLAIYLTGKAWLTEIEGYREFFASLGWAVELVPPQKKPTTPPDIEWVFPGVGGRRKFKDSFLVHDYPGSTQGSWPKVKDWVKRHFNVRPDLRIFHDQGVRERFNFGDDVPYCIRPAGVHRRFFDVAKDECEKEYDFVYVGTFWGRPEAEQAIEMLASSKENWKILVVGVDAHEGKPLPGVDYMGRIPYDEVPKQLARARYGLVLMPNRYPYNRQEAIKFFEYSAAGLGIISLPGIWLPDYVKNKGGKAWILEERSPTRQELEAAQLEPIDVSEREWLHHLSKSGIVEKIDELIRAKEAEK